ncbi:MAG TPA: YbhB/YbcL family Raf kinase inhibitor-like protein [Usitatibacteraceae bacterium]|nr:YbhB/YbcL family Raf kinase inhibitor-like protein [Usitatibacteraceae bacterium]
MQVTSTRFADGGAIPADLAFCKLDAKTHATLSDNRNPPLAWSGAPAGTKSFVVVCHDPDVPSRGDDVNQEGRVVPASLPRVDFTHWLLVDLPATVTAVAEGEFSSAVTAKGKPGPAAPHGARQGVNDYTAWFAGDADMGGQYFGYDGPCPPWNDEIPHRYVFTVYALDVARLPVEGAFTRAEALAAMQGRVLASCAITGRYTLNPAVKL